MSSANEPVVLANKSFSEGDAKSRQPSVHPGAVSSRAVANCTASATSQHPLVSMWKLWGRPVPLSGC